MAHYPDTVGQPENGIVVSGESDLQGLRIRFEGRPVGETDRVSFAVVRAEMVDGFNKGPSIVWHVDAYRLDRGRDVWRPFVADSVGEAMEWARTACRLSDTVWSVI